MMKTPASLWMNMAFFLFTLALTACERASDSHAVVESRNVAGESTSGKVVYPALTTDPLACNGKAPDALSWLSTPPLLSPKPGDFSVKDPSVVYYNNAYHIFATVNNGSWKSMYTTLDNFNGAAQTQYQMFSPGNTGSSAVAPQVFYFTPQKRWYIFTQWPATYTTNTDIADINGWSPRVALAKGTRGAFDGNALDFWVICNAVDCYLYYFKDDGNMYYISTPIDAFPEFDPDAFKVADIQQSGPTHIVFEAGNIYKIRGTDYYLLQVEGWGQSEGRRFYRSWVSTRLEGPWVSHRVTEDAPFAGIENTTFDGEPWSHQISHGEMIRAGYDEKMELDPCAMKMLYQGVDLSGFDGTYGQRPYHIGLLQQN